MTAGLEWNGAACKGRGELFFGPDDEAVSKRNWRESRAKAICARCPLRSACLDHALAEGITDGVWGGVTEAGRAALRFRRRKKVNDRRYRERQVAA